LINKTKKNALPRIQTRVSWGADGDRLAVRTTQLERVGDRWAGGAGGGGKGKKNLKEQKVAPRQKRLEDRNRKGQHDDHVEGRRVTTEGAYVQPEDKAPFETSQWARRCSRLIEEGGGEGKVGQNKSKEKRPGQSGEGDKEIQEGVTDLKRRSKGGRGKMDGGEYNKALKEGEKSGPIAMWGRRRLRSKKKREKVAKPREERTAMVKKTGKEQKKCGEQKAEDARPLFGKSGMGKA